MSGNINTIETGAKMMNDQKNFLLVGSPNSGKTTLYNWLTGAKTKTVNYPGATVEYSIGVIQKSLAQSMKSQELHFVDTPGVYSLDAQTADEKVTVNLLSGYQDLNYEAVIVVIDATQMNRQLLLAKQVTESKVKTIVVLTMSDLIEKQKQRINLDEIKKFLNISDVILFDGILGRGLEQIVLTLNQSESLKNKYTQLKLSESEKVQELKIIAQFLKEKAFYENLEKEEKKHQQNQSQIDLTLKIDRYLLHPIFGYVFFFVFMTLFFSSIYWMSAPLMDLVESALVFLADLSKQYIPGLWGEFVGDGLIAAITGVVIFIPQIFILFLGIGLFENSGYLARVAALIDGPLKKVGLGGRSFVPMLSGFACAVPALMATRNITSTKERLIAQMVIPFMSCSARLPVYGLMIGFLFKEENVLMAGLIMTTLYFSSLVVGAVASAVLSKIIESRQTSRLLMDLPYYRRPRLKTILLQSVDKSISFVKRAGPVIMTLAIVLWFATQFPKSENPDVPVQSYAMQVANAIEPVFKPMGLDGRVGFALLASFAAREVFVSSLAISFNVDQGGDEENQSPIIDRMHQATFADGTPIFTLGSVIGILIFFLIATQCLSTVGVLKKESGGWKWTLIQLFGSNILAYSLAVIVVQIFKYLNL